MGEVMGGVRIESRPRGKGLRVHDPQSAEQFSIRTPTAVEPDQCQADVPVPVSDVVRFRTAGLTILTAVTTHVRREDGTIEESLRFGDQTSRNDNRWVIEFSTPVKTYLFVDGPFDLAVTESDVRLRWSGDRDVTLGVRSYRRHPDARLTTTESPADIAEAISHLGTAIQTFSPERSFPTLRNHPPRITVGDELQIPEEVDRPPTGVTIETPLSLQNLYALAPISFYLGADLTEGEAPRILLDTGTTYPLSTTDIASKCEQLLKQLVFLDCLTRVEGLYPFELKEVEQLDPELSLDWESLYETSLAARTERFLEVTFEDLSPAMPRWPAVAVVEPRASGIEAIPHLLDQLLPIHPTRPERISGSDARRRALDRFMASDSRPTRSGGGVFRDSRDFVDLPSSDAHSQLWVGDDIPLGGNRLHRPGIENYHSLRPKDRSDISVTVVCNDSEMYGEFATAESVYGTREQIPFEIDSHEHVGTESLETMLAEPRDFFHFIGHASDDGLHCPDGILDPGTINAVEVRTFFLNACSSYAPGMALVDQGSIGGVVTLSDINETSAQEVGAMVARLLDGGFSLRTALTIARQRSIVGGQYICVGMDSYSLTHPEGGVAYACELASTSDHEQVLEVVTYPTRHWGIGSVATFQFDQAGEYILAGNTIHHRTGSQADVGEFLSAKPVPVRVDGQWYWSDDSELPVPVRDHGVR